VQTLKNKRSEQKANRDKKKEKKKNLGPLASNQSGSCDKGIPLLRGVPDTRSHFLFLFAHFFQTGKLQIPQTISTQTVDVKPPKHNPF
jgi:hypothetical protein